MRVVLNAADSLADAYRLLGDIYGVPYILPIVTGDFDGAAVVRVSEGVDRLLLRYENGEEETVPVDGQLVTVMPKYRGKATLIPYCGDIGGIDCVIWRENALSEYLDRIAKTVKPPYHGDYNLCEGGCGIWSLIREMQRENHRVFDSEVLPDLDITVGRTLPYVARKTIAPTQEGFAPYHIYQSDRLQEQFFGVSILLDAYRLYGDVLYLDYATRALDELIDNWITPEGMISRHGHDYTTVTCPVIPIVDMAVFFRNKDVARYDKYREVAVRVADFVVKRGINFPTEGESTNRTQQFEDGSISCSALTVLYVAMHLERKPAYLTYGDEILKFHEAWRINSPDARMFGSSMRWWETIWEGDADGPAICAGHAWTVWRSEALYLLGVLTHNSEAMLDSWNGFVTNFSKADAKGNMYAIYTPDYIPGGGFEEERRALLTVPEDRIPKRYKLAHGYPEQTDRSLSRYAVVRFADTWLHTAAVIDVDGETVYIRCKNADGSLQCDAYVDSVYLDTKQVLDIDRRALRVL